MALCVEDLKRQSRLRRLRYCKEALNRLKAEGKIKNYKDLCGDDEQPFFLFPFLLNHLGYLLDSEDRKAFSVEEIQKRAFFNKVMRMVGPAFLKSPQIFEDRAELKNLNKGSLGEPSIPEGPVIYVANHGFHDDILGTVLACDRHAYVMFGSLPHFFNTIDGPLLYENGVVLVNRKIKNSKRESLTKCKMLLENGCSIIIYPEGVWNKSPNQFSLPLWNGVYRLAKETGATIVPIVHYINDPTYTKDKKDNPMHTVVDDAIDVTLLSQDEVLEAIRESFATWYYLMMEKYGQSTRQELVGSFQSSQEAWKDQLRKRIKTADKYDSEIETSADYRPKDVATLDEVFTPIANLDATKERIMDVIAAKKLIKEYKKNDFQHKY